MIYVGIDIAKLNHFAAAISSEGGEVLIEPFKFTNDYDGFYLLLSKLNWHHLTSPVSSQVLNQRHTTMTTLFVFLLPRILKCVLNPLSTSSMRKNNVRKKKTDKVDTFVIAKTLMVQDSLRFLTLKDLDYIELKELGRFRQKTVKQIFESLNTMLHAHTSPSNYENLCILIYLEIHSGSCLWSSSPARRL